MKIVEGFKLRDVVGQATIIGEGIKQINFNKLITLNSSAAYLWQSVEGKEFTVEDLAILLIQCYDIPLDKAMRDAESIVEVWMQNGIIR